MNLAITRVPLRLVVLPTAVMTVLRPVKVPLVIVVLKFEEDDDIMVVEEVKVSKFKIDETPPKSKPLDKPVKIEDSKTELKDEKT